MKVVILAGGLGTRLAEETGVIPKPMVEIGGYPILWHIMKIYSHYGLNEFIVCLGYKGYCIKEYFLNYRAHSNDLTINTGTGDLEFHCNRSEKWIISLIETGARTLTGGRLKRVREYVQDEDFCMTYGDGVANVNIAELLKYHEAQGRLATVTSVKPPGRFGALDIRDGKVTRFLEKPSGDQGAINGGFFVLSPKVLDLIEGDHTTWEQEPMEELARTGQLAAFQHKGFWQPMDTLRDKNTLNRLWDEGKAEWKLW